MEEKFPKSNKKVEKVSSVKQPVQLCDNLYFILVYFLEGLATNVEKIGSKRRRKNKFNLKY